MIGLSDLLLSHAQKEAIDTLATKLWDEADEIRKLSFADRFKHQKVNRTAVSFVGLLLFSVFYSLSPEHPLLTIAGYLAFFLCVWVGPYVFAWTEKNGLQTLVWPFVMAGASVVIAMSINGALGPALAAMSAYLMFVGPLYVAVLYICAAGVTVVEFILRRVAEFPKGAVAAVGAILAFISGLYKAF